MTKRLVEIEVDRLFDLFHHRIELREPVTIVHGPNGYGKTVMLKMVHAFASNKMSIFTRVPFNWFALKFDDGTKLIIRPNQTHPEESPKSERRLEFIVQEPGRAEKTADHTVPLNDGPLGSQLFREFDQYVPHPYIIRGTRWRDPSTPGSASFSFEEILQLFPELETNPLVPEIRGLFQPAEVRALREQVTTYFVHTQRLHNDPEPRQSRFQYDEQPPPERRLSVEIYSGELVSQISSALADYGKRSQQLDRTFPARLVEFSRLQSQPLSEAHISDSLKQLDERRETLMRIGLLDQEASLGVLSQADVQAALQALTIYVQDSKEKLDVFSKIAVRIELFIDTINSRLAYKALGINREDGFRVRPLGSDKKPLGSPIHIGDLSSGEQHEIVVLFELLFKVPTGALVLIDEPELSLHAAWQSSFLEDLMSILKATEASAIVATHSPMIIGERWDLAQQLRGPE